MFFSTNSRQTFYDWGQYAFLCTRSFKKLKFCSASKKGNNFFRKFCRTYFSNDRQCFSDVSHCGKKEKKGEKNRDQAKKKVGERSEPRGILGRRKGGAVLYPSPGYRWARFACRYFFLFDHVFCLFPPLRSVVPGYSDGSSCNHKKQFVDSWTVNWVRYFLDMMRLIKMYER